jgi:hypothetical protein
VSETLLDFFVFLIFPFALYFYSFKKVAIFVNQQTVGEEPLATITSLRVSLEKYFLKLKTTPTKDIMLNSDDEDLDCPLCMEELDIADRNFRPCPCGYQVSGFYACYVI